MRIFMKHFFRYKWWLSASILLLLSLTAGSASVQAAGQSRYRITVEDIYQRTFEKAPYGLISYECRNKKGNSLPEERRSAASASSFSENTSLPASYDLRKSNCITPIKNQGYSGSCWAFAALKSLESNLIKSKKAPASLDLSENHLSWYLFNPSKNTDDPLYLDGITFRESAAKSAYLAENSAIRNSYSYSSYYDALPYIKGSNALLGAFVLARWSGAVPESTAPFQASTTKNLFAMADTMKKNSDALRYQTDYHLTDAICYDSATGDEIKKALMESGALEASFYYDDSHLTKNLDGTFAYYQKEKDPKEANHSVTIIGWDDNFSREHFGGNPPARNGAWLVANSYGTDYGQAGYFRLSYEEASLGEIYGFHGTKKSTYDNNYQYDGSGWGSTLLPWKNQPMKVANIFTAKKNYTQSLEAVALYTVTPEQPYTIQIYRDVQEGNPTGGTLAATLSGTEKYSGYHTISLAKSVSLKANERFSVVVSYHRTSDKNGFIPIEGKPLYSTSLAMNFHSTPGKSFCYAYATNTESGEKSYQWVDLNTPISTEENASETVYNNVCIKAFTLNKKRAGSLRLSPASCTLGTGEKISLSPVIKQTTQTAIKYTSSDTSVASVSSKGKIRAKKKGKAVITATLPTGAFATMKVKVKAAPRKIRTTPRKKKILNRKKSFKIKVKLPAGSASYQITYTSSNSKVAKVSKKGKVTGKKAGTATITAKTYNKKKAKIKVTVR